MPNTSADTTGFAEDFLQFLDDSPTPFHAVSEVEKTLQAAGFSQLREEDAWALDCGRKYYVIRGGTSLLAFIVGRSRISSGFKIIGAHTDSPTLKLKPNFSYKQSGYFMFGVEPYGSGIWRTWLDRDLFPAGCIIVKNGKKLSSYLVSLPQFVINIPSVAIHLDREVNTLGPINSQVDLNALIALENDFYNLKDFQEMLLESVNAKGVIVSSALQLCSAEHAVFAGPNKTLIHSGQLDNLASCYVALSALSQVGDPEATCVISLWDHEEVGSDSAQGAGGPFLRDVLARLYEGSVSASANSDFRRSLAHSFCISADMAHAVHPNHPEKHDPHHTPKIGGGPVLKFNAEQRYATDAFTAAVFDDICLEAGVPYQRFSTRSDIRCGSTIGPITASDLGIRVVDIGNPVLAMHSIRETCGIFDLSQLYLVFETFFSRGREEVSEE